MYSYASSHVASRNSPSSSLSSGSVRRSSWSTTSVAAPPLIQIRPSLTGASPHGMNWTSPGSSPGCTWIPHPTPQYGQIVLTGSLSLDIVGPSRLLHPLCNSHHLRVHEVFYHGTGTSREATAHTSPSRA